MSDVLGEGYYKKYRNKKFFRMKLMQKHGIANYKEFEWSKLIISAYQDLREICFDKKPTMSVITGIVKNLKYKTASHYSTLSVDDLAREIDSMTGLETDINKLAKKLKEYAIKVEFDGYNPIITKHGTETGMDKLEPEELEDLQKLVKYYKTQKDLKMRHLTILRIFEEYQAIMG